MRPGGSPALPTGVVLLAVGCAGDSRPQPAPGGEGGRPATEKAPASSSVDDHGLAEVADRLFELTNEARQADGLPPLHPHPQLFEAARNHAIEMAENNFLSHESLDGSTLRERLPGDFNAKAAAENVWGGSLDSRDSLALAENIFEGWMRSPGHRTNLLSADYAHLGVAVASADREVRAVQVFAARLR